MKDNDEKQSPPEETSEKTADIIDFQKEKEERRPETLSDQELDTLLRKKLLAVALDAARQGYPMVLVVQKPDALNVMTTEDASSTHSLLSCGQKIMLDELFRPEGPSNETPDKTVH